MRWLPRAAPILAVAVLLGAALPLLDPGPPKAEAASIPCVGISPAGAVAGAIGIGDPIGDACDAVSDPILGVAGKALDPLRDAASSIGKGVFNQVTAWVADGAVWLIGEVAVLSEKTTSPDLLSRGFLRQYGLMAQIAAMMAALMAIFAVFESLGRGDAGMLWRVFLVNVPLAAIATTSAYVVVQLLLATCDGLCDAISQSAGADSRKFFESAIEALAQAGASGGAVAGSAIGGPTGAGTGAGTGGAAVPLFVGFIAAILAAFAAFFVWIELLMRDAAIYVVALFMPLAIAASIWPRWVSALRRTCELIIVIVFSKFVIVAIVSLAASLLARNEGAVEQVLAASAMLLLACFSPFMLFKLVPFAEGAMSAAYNRPGASGGAVRGMRMASQGQMMRRATLANWSGGGGQGGESGGGAVRGRPTGGGADAGRGRVGGAQGAPAAGAGAVAMPAAAGLGAAQAGASAAGRLARAGAAQAVAAGGQGPGSAEAPEQGGGGTGGEAASPTPAANPAPPSDRVGRSGSAVAQPKARQGGTGGAEPMQAPGHQAPDSSTRVPRPPAETGVSPEEGKS